jgi:diguanylate cyclase (GGDEF)-like protein
MTEKKSCVLVASADPKIREMVRIEVLAQGLEPVLCGDGNEAVQSGKSAGHGSPALQLAVLEMYLPKLDGFEVAKRFSQFESAETVPVLMILDPGMKFPVTNAPVRLNADDYLGKPFEKEELHQKIRSMIRHPRPHGAPHPVTRLPGHPQFEHEIFARIQKAEAFATVWMDINHFRPFNDHCGREKGDEVILMVAGLIHKALQTTGNAGAPIAHVDGDDFAVLLPQEDAESFRRQLKESFSKESGKFYTPEEKKQGFIREKDREQKEQVFPLMSLCSASIPVTVEQFVHYGQLVSRADDLLRQAKQGSQEPN